MDAGEEHEAQESSEKDAMQNKEKQLDQESSAEEERLAREVEKARLVARKARHMMELEYAERQQTIALFLKQRGFRGINSAKVSLLSKTYPLHKAAEEGNARLVAMLLKGGALIEQKNSSGKTAVQVARSKNKNGSHLETLSVLSSALSAPFFSAAGA